MANLVFHLEAMQSQTDDVGVSMIPLWKRRQQIYTKDIRWPQIVTTRKGIEELAFEVNEFVGSLDQT